MPGPIAPTARPAGRPLQVWHVLARDALGGTELMTVALTARSPAHGVASTVVILDEPGPIAERLAAAGVTVHSLGGAGERTALRRLARLVRGHQVDVLCGYGFKTGLLTRLIGRSLSRRTATVTGVRGLYVTEIEEIDSPRGRFVMAVERATARLVDAYVANSTGALDVLAAHGIERSRLHYVPNGIDGDRWPAADRETRDADIPPVVLCAGRFTPVKRQTDLVAAAALLRDRGVDAGFRFAGTGPLLETVTTQAAEAGLLDRVEFLGGVDPAAMAGTLAGADIACLVSSQEGMPGAVMEAMASGLPVVGTAVNGIRDLVVDGRTGRLVPACDPASLADALEPLIVDASLRRRLGAAGRDRIHEDFSLNGMVEATCALHRALVSAR